ncbi:MAG: DUF3127 domain-containing protein [Microscillaceae bacterium]|jgi:hypothetical protein|nr:DUF3127 domain-containing protein [Microscillaceae bacterium]
MGLEITGQLFEILSEQSGTGKNGIWRKQEFVIDTTAEQYPKKVCFTVWGDRINQLSSFNIGDNLKVSFDVESRPYQGKWYTDLKAWKIENTTGNAAASASSTAKPAAKPAEAFASDPFPQDLISQESTDDLPF